MVHVAATVPFVQVGRTVMDDRETSSQKPAVSWPRTLLLGSHVAGINTVEVKQFTTPTSPAGLEVCALATFRLAHRSYPRVSGAAAPPLPPEPRPAVLQ